jgi:hypothetical protein
LAGTLLDIASLTALRPSRRPPARIGEHVSPPPAPGLSPATTGGRAGAERLSQATRPARRLRWWVEVVVAVVLYALYMAIRNAHGSATVATQFGRALANGRAVFNVERAVHLDVEHGIQQLALHSHGVVVAANVFYTTAHFVVTAAVLVWLYRRQKHRYRQWRTILVVGTGLALVGFTVFPVLPPRLLPASYGFTDTLRSFGGLWSFNSGAIERISDPFAAMPSLHLCWATWCAAVLLPGLRSRWTRATAVAYPLVTSVVVLITGNHYLLDLVGGTACLALAWASTEAACHLARRLSRSHPESGEPLTPAPSDALVA